MMADSYNPRVEAGELQMGFSLVYIVSFSLAWSTEQGSVSVNQTKPPPPN